MRGAGRLAAAAAAAAWVVVTAVPAGAAAGSVVAAAASGCRPSVAPLQMPVEGADINAVNKHGVVVGTTAFRVDRYGTDGVVWDRTGLHRLPSPGSRSSASDVDSYGRVVGAAADAQGYTRPAAWTGGRLTILSTSFQGSAVATNDAGDVLMDVGHGDGRVTSALLRGGVEIPLVPPDWTSSIPLALSENGAVLGTEQRPSGSAERRYWVWRAGVFRTLPGTDSTLTLTTLNEDGTAAGWQAASLTHTSRPVEVSSRGVTALPLPKGATEVDLLAGTGHHRYGGVVPGSSGLVPVGYRDGVPRLLPTLPSSTVEPGVVRAVAPNGFGAGSTGGQLARWSCMWS